jgi:UDP-N-acetylmuramyl pentapeptide phosphotransferase/UDP-N-acetylglucosamine-1-phosphate transferase
MYWFDFNIIYFMGISLVLNGFIAYLWHKKFYEKLGLRVYQAVQRIHLNETPRLGGFIFILSLAGYLIFSDDFEGITLLKLILFCLIPIVVIGLKEDLFHNVGPIVRLLSLFFVSWLFICNYSGPLANLSHIPFLGRLSLVQGGISLFYIIGMVTIANGMNLVDGVHGLCGLVCLSILSALLFISYKASDIAMLSLIFTLILLLIPFILINYPYGRIFLGDLGAYSLGLIVSMLTIILFGRHQEISPWGAVLILAYPATEVIFSLVRRLKVKGYILKPDTFHLHLKLFKFLQRELRHKKFANALVAPILSPLWLFSPLVISWCYHKPLLIYAGIFFFITIYISVYYTVPNIQKKPTRNKSKLSR